MAENYLTIEDVAKRLGLTNSEVVEAATQGRLRGLRDGSTYRFRDEDVKKYIEEQKKTGDSVLNYDYDDEADAAGSSDINSTLDKDTSLFAGDSGISSDSGLGLADSGTLKASDSIVSDYDGDDTGLVLDEVPASGGSSGSGLLGEGSGISLLSADDSGITLDDSSDVLELPEDAFGSSIAGGLSGSLVASLTNVGNDEDFRLSAGEGLDEDEDDDSGSQVIELDEDSEDGGNLGFDITGGGGGTAPVAMTPMVDPALLAELEDLRRPEKPYSVWNLLGLIFCFIFLGLTMMFTVDLLRNMWSWDQPTQFSSSMMDWVIDNIVKKVQEQQQGG